MGVWDTVGALGVPGILRVFSRRYEFHNVTLSRTVDRAYQALAIDEKRRYFEPAVWTQQRDAGKQVLAQAWFPGVHMDVGGGYRGAGLSNAALLWIQQAAAAAGLEFDAVVLGGFQPDSHAPLHNSRKFPFTLLPPHIRSIAGRDRSWETIHESARARYRDDESYRPRNLVQYMEEHGLD
jgi:uncharacterized protein (DUF2235 family)